MIEVHALKKHYGEIVAVDGLSFKVTPGHVTGFLGPNGAGKSTTMRMILGLDTPTSGSAHVAGRPYRNLAAPMREVGALLDPQALHPGRNAHAHLRWLARAGGIPVRRVDEVLELVGLREVARRRIGDFSLGMRQRLGIAWALLGDPDVLLLDEPLNGLDAEGIVWVRTLLNDLAAQGRTVFLSSHLMNEMEATADHVLVIGNGQLIADVSVEELTRRAAGTKVIVVSPQVEILRELLLAEDATVIENGANELAVSGVEASRVGEIAARHGVPLHELTPQRHRLEDAFMDLTRQHTSHSSGTTDSTRER